MRNYNNYYRDCDIKLCKKKGKKILEWGFYSKNSISTGKYYTYKFKK